MSQQLFWIQQLDGHISHNTAVDVNQLQDKVHSFCFTMNAYRQSAPIHFSVLWAEHCYRAQVYLWRCTDMHVIVIECTHPWIDKASYHAHTSAVHGWSCKNYWMQLWLLSCHVLPPSVHKSGEYFQGTCKCSLYEQFHTTIDALPSSQRLM